MSQSAPNPATINLYIMRHGIAVDHDEWSGPDFSRPLTPEGRTRTRELLAALHASGELKVDAVWTSPLVRARQTAEIVCEVVGLQYKIVDALECGADLDSLKKYAKKNPPPARLITVGHEPDCGVITMELVGDDTGDYAFKRAGIAHLEGKLETGGMKLIFKYAPKDVIS